MIATRVIRRPVVTEKAAFASGTFNRHTFEIDSDARKADVKAAVEELYGVRVQAVAIQNRKSQQRRSRFGYWKTPATKRAIVKIHPDDRIELF
ncbi:MAG: 50S ribosomal protein L23 [Planctomycetota bacterium]|nr:50S ribosomal protein L23 [Planctomycetota bacterium]